MQNYAKVGGVLTIISGAFGVLGLFMMIFGALFSWLIFSDPEFYIEGESPVGFLEFMVAIYVLIGLFQVLAGALAIVGGIFALKKKYWGWALAGSIAGTVTFFPCGIPAIIFVSLGRSEFNGISLPAPPPAPTVAGT